MQFSPNCPNCFCGLPASPVYSEEFGLLYECHNLHNNPWIEEIEAISKNVNGRESPDSDQVRLKKGFELINIQILFILHLISQIY